MARARVVVVGAGMAGLTAARRMHDRGLDVVVLDKGRAVGGRMATRRLGSATFDHGAQHFSVRSEAFEAFIEPYRASGLVRGWYRTGGASGAGSAGETRWVGRGGMRRIPEAIAEGLHVLCGVQVTGLERTGTKVTVYAGASSWAADAVVVTPPPAQTARLLGSMPEMGRVVEKLSSFRYDPSLAVMVTLDGPSGLPDGHLALADGGVAWIADNRHKGVSALDALTIHASAEFSARHFETEPGRWTALMCDEAQRHLDSAIVDATPHRWRFAQPQNPSDDGALVAGAGVPIVVAGEAFSGARVEGAFTSGWIAAGRILDETT